MRSRSNGEAGELVLHRSNLVEKPQRVERQRDRLEPGKWRQLRSPGRSAF